MDKCRVTFEEIFEKNGRRVNFHIHRLRTSDAEQKSFQGSLFTMWHAYKRYQLDNGPLATYFNYFIRNSVYDLIKNQEKESKVIVGKRSTYSGDSPSYTMKVVEKSL